MEKVADAGPATHPAQAESHGPAASLAALTVGALGVGPGPGGGQGADLAELNERGRSHVAVDAAADGHIEVVPDQAFYR